MGLPYEIDEGGGAFYGPKIDVKIKDAIGRLWQCSTIQFDFNLPERFDMEYVGPDNKRHRPYMVHRAIFGSIERFVGVLLEHYAGLLPLWLSPVQVKVIPISPEKHGDYAREVEAYLKNKGIRVELDLREERLNARVRDAELQRFLRGGGGRQGGRRQKPLCAKQEGRQSWLYDAGAVSEHVD